MHGGHVRSTPRFAKQARRDADRGRQKFLDRHHRLKWREPREADPIPKDVDAALHQRIDEGIAFAAHTFAPHPPEDVDVCLAKALARTQKQATPSVRQLLDAAFLFGASSALLYTPDLPQEDSWIGVRWAVESQRRLTIAFLEMPAGLRSGLIGRIDKNEACTPWVVCMRGAGAVAQCAYHFSKAGMRIFLPRMWEDAHQKIDLFAVMPGTDSGLLLQVKNIRDHWSHVRFLDDQGAHTNENKRLRDEVEKINNRFQANWKAVTVHVGMLATDFKNFEHSRHLSDSIKALLRDPRLKRK